VQAILRDFPLLSLFDNMRRIGVDKYRGVCPFHGGDNANGIGVEKYKDRWRWRCYTGDCGYGSAIDVVRMRERCSFMEALDILDGGKVDVAWSPAADPWKQLYVKREPGLTLICDGCGDETLDVGPRTYGNGTTRPLYTDSAYGTALGSGWELAAGGIACVGPRCLGRIGA
jgi:hypothetical protein